jgi:ABC-type nickel/cobalt efflux system permease component RcnA
VRARWAALAVAALGLLVLAPGTPASAHPLGNFSVNQLGAFSLHPERVELRAVVDFAEIPTYQERSTVEAAGPSYAERTCAEVAGGYAVSVAGERLSWTPGRSSFEYGPGAEPSLPTSRLTCELSAEARLDRPAGVTIESTYLNGRVGWRELTVAGFGVQPRGNVPPARSVSDDLRVYPSDLLSSPLDMRTASFETAPGVDARADVSARVPASAVPGWLGKAEAKLRALVGGDLTPWVGLLAVLLAIVLGAAHAALPGHGKTVMAMYLAGRAGRPRDALVVGATVTLTHTGGVIVVGLLLAGALSVAGERVLGWLGLVSGILVVVVGATMLRSALKNRGGGHGHHHHHHHGHGDHDHDHAGHGDHDHGYHSGHSHHPSPRGRGRLGLAAIGVAGGLVPSPSALVVLLGAIGLGRTAFGLLLVLAYGAGMAATLTAAGLLLLRLRDRWVARVRRGSSAGGSAGRRPTLGARLAALAGRLGPALPATTAGAVLLLGAGIAGRAIAGVF